MLLVEYYKKNSQLDLMLNALEELCKLPLEIGHRINFFLKLIETVLEMEEYSRGFACCQELLKLAKQEPLLLPFAHFFLGSLCVKTKREQEALEQFTAALVATPPVLLCAMIYMQIAKIYKEQNQSPNALSYYQAALEQPLEDDSLKSKIYNEMATIYYEMNNLDAALKMLGLAKNLINIEKQTLEIIEKNHQFLSNKISFTDDASKDECEPKDYSSEYS